MFKNIARAFVRIVILAGLIGYAGIVGASRTSAADLNSAFMPGCSTPSSIEKLGPSMFNTRTVLGPAIVLGAWDRNVNVGTTIPPFENKVVKTFVPENQAYVFYLLRGTIKSFSNTPACRHNARIFFARDPHQAVSLTTLVDNFLAAPNATGMCETPQPVTITGFTSFTVVGPATVRNATVEMNSTSGGLSGEIVVHLGDQVNFDYAIGVVTSYAATQGCESNLLFNAHVNPNLFFIPLDTLAGFATVSSIR